MRNLKTLFLTSILLLMMCGAGISAKPALPIVLYDLLPGTSFEEGCVGPCTCPVMIYGNVQGNFGVVATPSSNAQTGTLALTNIAWVVLDTNNQVVHKIRGGGTYRFRTIGNTAVKHQLTLNISIDGQTPVSLDSGQVVGWSQFPRFAISVRRGSECFDIVMDIIAAPAGRRR